MTSKSLGARVGPGWKIVGYTVTAALLLIATLWLPLWTMSLEAPQYPRGLYMRAYGSRVTGDLREINIINHYVGMEVIDEVPAPEMKLFPYAVVALALAVFAAPLHRRLLQLSFVAVTAMPVITLADLQWWLHRFGQNLDPHAPLNFVEPFTPLAIGISKIGNFRSIAMISYGFLAMFAAATLLYWALRAWPADATGGAPAAAGPAAGTPPAAGSGT